MIITSKLVHHTCRIQTILSPKFQFDFPIATTQVITVSVYSKKYFMWIKWNTPIIANNKIHSNCGSKSVELNLMKCSQQVHYLLH